MNKKVVLKIFISVILTVFIFSKIDLSEFFRALVGANLIIFIISFVSLIFQQCIISYTWYIVVKAQKNEVSLRKIIRIHFIGNYFGMFMPTSIGMDLIRAYSLSKHLAKGVDAASSMFVIRVIGFLVLFLMALVVCMFRWHLLEDRSIVWVIVLATVAFISGVVVMFIPPMRLLLYRLLPVLRVRRVKEKLESFYLSTMAISSAKALLTKIVIISFIMQGIGIINFYLVGKSLHIPLPLAYYFLYLPIIQVIVMIPISIAGIGVRESTFVYFFSQIGVTQAEALSLSLLVFSQAVGIALIGGMLFLLSGFPEKKNQYHRQSQWY